MNCDVILLHGFVCLFVFMFFFLGVGAREIITMDYKYNSAEQGKTTTSGLQDLLECELSTHDLASLDRGSQWD